VHGIEAITKSVGGFLDDVHDFQTRTTKIIGVVDDYAVVAEFTGSGVAIGTGRPYAQTYLVYLRAQSGKIVLLREYFDPSCVVAAFGP
jgi:ketosteroid isomerase-like protein